MNKQEILYPLDPFVTLVEHKLNNKIIHKELKNYTSVNKGKDKNFYVKRAKENNRVLQWS